MELPKYFEKDNKVIDNKDEMVHELNQFFVNVGYSLANEIPITNDQLGGVWKRENRIMHSMYR